ncbi:MAG: OmpA family protein [Pseudomonadota bacterium]
MSLRVLVCSTAALAALTVLAPAEAQDNYIAPSIVYTDDDGLRGVDDEVGGAQVVVGTHFNDWFALEGLLGSSSLSGGDSLDLLEIGFNGRFIFRGDKNLAPYFLFGAGLFDVDSANLGSDRAFYETIGFGIDWRFDNSPFSVRLETRRRNSNDFGSDLNDRITSLGVAYAFGSSPAPAPAPAPAVVRDSDGDGVRDDIDRCPSTPNGYAVDAKGCALDGDRDGVADAIDKCPNSPRGASVDARGCELDGDNDGVVNSKDRCPNSAAGARVDVNGCEIKDVIDLPGVNFETNSDRLLPGAERELADAVATMRKHPDLRVEVAGHTDSAGNADYNQGLSERRASTVRDYLINTGADADKLTARGYGEADPVASNDSAEGRARNRRVELRIIE